MTEKSNPWALALILAMTMAVVFGAPALAQLEVSSSTFDGGGGTSTGGSFEVSGTAGQFDAGSASGGSFDLESGFWTSENPAVPVELQSFEIVSSRLEDARELRLAAVAEEPICRREGRQAVWLSARLSIPRPPPSRLRQPSWLGQSSEPGQR